MSEYECVFVWICVCLSEYDVCVCLNISGCVCLNMSVCVCIVPEYIVDPLWMTADSMEERAESQAEDCRDKEEQED